MGMSVSDWLRSNPSYFIGNAVNPDGNMSYYFRVPKADGGFDYYRDTSGDIRPISEDQAVYQATEGQFPRPVQTTETQYAGGSSGLTEAQRRAAINSHLANLDSYKRQGQKAESDYNIDLNKLLQGEQDLYTSRGQGFQSNNAYFGSISPDAYQSQIQNYNTKVLDAYNQGMKTIATNKQNIAAAKQNTLNDINAAVAAENSFDASTGSYDKPYTYQNYNYVAPAITPVTQSPYAQSAKIPGVAQWSPNKVGTQEDTWAWLA